MDPADGQALLALARRTIEARLADRPAPPLPDVVVPAETYGGAFVTLKNRGRLRGCIGRFGAAAGLAETVREMAVAALNDPRFRSQPVTLEELPALTIEISVLSPMRRTDAPLSLEPGRHGIYVRKGLASGCFLPQVATEQGWDAEQFLSRCCSGKAGLPADAWKDPGTDVYLFTADVFTEEKPA